MGVLLHRAARLIAITRNKAVGVLEGAILSSCPVGWDLDAALARGDLDAFSRICREARDKGPVYGINGHYRYRGYDTPLGRAIEFGSAGDVQNLLAAGARPNVLTKDGLHPLHRAVQRGRVDIVNVLIEAGAPLEQFNRFGRTPLYECVLWLDVYRPSIDGRWESCLEVLRALTKAGANIDSLDYWGVSAIANVIHERTILELATLGATVARNGTFGPGVPDDSGVSPEALERARAVIAEREMAAVVAAPSDRSRRRGRPVGL